MMIKRIILISFLLITLIGCESKSGRRIAQPDSVYLFLEYDDFDNCISVKVVNARNEKIAINIYDVEYFLQSKGDRYEMFKVDVIKMSDKRKYLTPIE